VEVHIRTCPDIDDKNLTAIVSEKGTKIQELKTEKDSEVGALNYQLEVKKISVYCYEHLGNAKVNNRFRIR
jgi:hypothetical protein